MGNLVRVAEGEAAPSGMDAVHGVVHRLKPADMAKLAHLEHEYRYSTVQYRERERERWRKPSMPAWRQHLWVPSTLLSLPAGCSANTDEPVPGMH